MHVGIQNRQVACLCMEVDRGEDDRDVLPMKDRVACVEACHVTPLEIGFQIWTKKE